MIETVSRKIAKTLIKNQTDQYNEEVLTYGAECFLNQFLANAILLSIGLLTGHAIDVILWSISFVMLRKNLGGFHAPSHFLCIASGSLIGASSLIVSPLLLSNQVISVLLLFFACITAVILAPVPHINKLYLLDDKPRIQRKVAVTLAAELLLAGILYFHFPSTAAYIVCAILYATFFAILGYFLNPR